MRVIVAGSRGITDYGVVERSIENSGFEVTEVVSGTARGVDTLGELWAKENGIDVKRFPADWNDFEHPKAVVKTREDGSKYNAAAGGIRNQKMADYAEGLVAVHDGESTGTENMIEEAKKVGLEISIVIV